MKNKKIAVCGYGYVGKAVTRFFQDHYDVVIYDPFLNEVAGTRTEVNECDLAVLCVPTEMREDGSVNLDAVYETFEWLNVPLVLIKSTVPPGTTDELIEKTGRNIVFSPEHIGEGKYETQWWIDRSYPHPTDMKKHKVFIFGGSPENTNKVLQFFYRVTGPEPRYMQTDSRTAELTKYMQNSWGAMKVTFCNEFKEIADTVGSDYTQARELLVLAGIIEPMHTVVFDNKRGFGGKCLPKDLNGIVKRSENSGYEPKLLKQVLESNKEFNKKNDKTI